MNEAQTRFNKYETSTNAREGAFIILMRTFRKITNYKLQ